MRHNGSDGGIPVLGARPQRVDWKNNAETHRLIASQVEESVRNAGGGIPMADPAGYLLAMLLLDRMDALERKLDHLTKLAERKSAIAHP